MWRTLRKVLSKRTGTVNLRECLGQVQIGDTNDGTNTVSSEQKHKLGKGDFIEHDLARFEGFEDGFNLMRAISLHVKNQKGRQNIARLTSFVGDGKEEEENNFGTFLDELKLWCSGVLALSSILSCKAFLYDKEDNIDIRKIPKVLYFFTIQNNPRTALAVLPIAQNTQELSAETSNDEDVSFSHAVSSFASASSEFTAACNNKLGVKYASKKQYEKAFAMFNQASEQGSALGQFNLGLCYENGKGTDQDLEKAVDCYSKASTLNHHGALYNLALFYIEGAGGLPKDHNKALELLEKAAQANIAKAQSYLGIYYAQKSPQDYSKAISYLEKAAIQKDDNAEYHLGVCYEHGLGVVRNLPMAGQMYKAAASHGNIAAQYNLGVFYENGLGDFPVDYKEALRYYRMAAEAGDKDAQHNFLLLSKQLEKSNFKQDILWTIFHKMTVGNGHADKGMARCLSTPNIVESHPKPEHDNGNPLVAF